MSDLKTDTTFITNSSVNPSDQNSALAAALDAALNGLQIANIQRMHNGWSITFITRQDPAASPSTS